MTIDDEGEIITLRKIDLYEVVGRVLERLDHKEPQSVLVHHTDNVIDYMLYEDAINEDFARQFQEYEDSDIRTTIYHTVSQINKGKLK